MINTIWNQFLETVKSYTVLRDEINEGCDVADLMYLEKELNVPIPEDLKKIYLTSNGQKNNIIGMFKAVSAFDVYEKLYFLNIRDIIKTYHTLSSDKNQTESINNLIPFASNSVDSANIRYIYCINATTNEVILLQTDAPDWTLPDDWQTDKVRRGNSLEDFVKYQILLY